MSGVGDTWALETPPNRAAAVRRVTVIGAGTMGLGIAEAAARVGIPTVVVKATGGDLDAPRDRHRAHIEGEVERGRFSVEERDRLLENLQWTVNFAGCRGSDLVIESVIEDSEAKARVLRGAAEAAPDAILATNTSTLPLAALAALAPRPELLVGLHFFNPVHSMPLVEVAGHPSSERRALEVAAEFARRLGKTPVQVAGTPGYVVNRMLVPYLLQAIDLWYRGIASIADVDRCMQLGCGMPMGPLALCDFIGLDVVLAMARTLRDTQHEGRFRPPGILGRLVEKGWTGRKAGMGFYDYATKPPAENNAIRTLKVR